MGMVAAARRSPRMWDLARVGERLMEFTALFLALTVVMLVAWWGSRALALALFAALLKRGR
jgi:hypothetical protein